MKTLALKKLIEQYKDDIETRIECIEIEKQTYLDLDDSGITEADAEIVDDYEAQIAHWTATLTQINEILQHCC